MDECTRKPKQEDACLTKLPLDVQMNLMDFLEPFDILMLRRTCHSLSYATRQRIVWINTLRNICIKNSVFLPTFSPEKMEIPELERAATAPYRWLLLKPQDIAHDGRLRPLTRRRISHEEITVDSQVYLVPGGRYLVTCPDDYVAVWDLDLPPSHISLEAQPLAKSDPVFHGGMFLVHPTPDGEGLRIFVNSNSSDDVLHDSEVYIVFEIYPNSLAPQLDKIASLKGFSLSDVRFYSMSRDTLVFLDGSILKVWDYKTDAWASWTITGPPLQAANGATGREYVQIITTPGCICLLHADGVSIWKIPPLVPSATKTLFSTVNLQPVPPLLECPYPSNVIRLLTSLDAHYLRCSGPCDWYSGNSIHPYTYDLVHYSDHDSTSMSQFLRFEVVIQDDLSAAKIVLRNAFSAPPLIWDSVAYRFCCGALTAWGFGLGKASILSESVACQSSVAEFELERPLPTRYSQKIHWLGTAAEFPTAAFCPVSGRVVSIDDEDCIVIEDVVPSTVRQGQLPAIHNYHHPVIRTENQDTGLTFDF